VRIARFLRVGRQRLRSVLRQDDVDGELERELAFHLEQLTAEKVADGLTLDEARLAARREFGNPALVAERSRDQRRVGWIHDLRQDLLYGWRMLRRSPGFTTVALASLALGIGGNAAVLGAMHAVLLQKLPFVHGERLVIIRTFAFANPEQARGASILDYFAWRDRARTLEAISVSLSGPRQFGGEPDGTPPESLTGLSVIPGWFQVLGAAPLHGRLFDEMTAVDDALVVVISHRLWQQRFGGAPGIIGRHVRMNGAPRRIVAVMPPDFRFQADNVESWMPMILGPEAGRQPAAGRLFGVLARLKPGVTIGQAQAELDAIAADLANASPERHGGWGVRVQPLREAMYGWTKAPLFTLQAAVALVLLITCTNVAGLSLARATVRRREMVVRAALGAGRGRIVRQLMAESVLLSGAGGLLGLFVAWVGLRVMTTALGPPPGAPRIGAMGLDSGILAVTALLSVLSALAFGLAPALAGGTVNLSAVLNTSAPAAGRHPGGHRKRGVLMATQIAFALVLLVVAGLLSKSFLRLSGRDINMDPSGLLTFEYTVPAGTYAKQIGDVRGLPYFELNSQAWLTIERVSERLRRLPGTVSVGGISYPPVNSLVLPTVAVIAGDGEPRDAQQVAHFLVTPNFFATMRTPIARGRDFDDRDTPLSPAVVVVNESMARRFWPGENALGKRVKLDDGPNERDREVIGVVRDIPTRLNQVIPEPVVYTSYTQQPSTYAGRAIGTFGHLTFVVRYDGDAAAMLSAARRAASEVDPNRPIVSVGTVERHLTARRRESRNYVLALAAFALTATLLSAIGVYGITAHAVGERTREIGIRRALGAGTREIASLVGRRVVPLIAAGLVAGLAGALVLTRWMSSQLWEVAPTDPATYAAVALLLAVVALLACLSPTRRAIAVNPTVVLRCE
jgi:putative ABC transport system permease protein